MIHRYIKAVFVICAAAFTLSVFASDEYAKDLTAVKKYISEKYSNNQKVAAFFNKKLEKITSSDLSNAEKSAELKKQFALAFAGHEKSVEEVVTDLFRRAHLKNEAKAQAMLGYCYYYGIGVTRDFKEAAKWLNKSVQNGEDGARYLLGVCRYYGQGLQKDQHKAIEHFQYAAQKDHHGAQLVMAICYHEGIDVEKEYFRSFEYLTKAVEDGCMVAQRILANCYYFGDGVSKDPVTAAAWYDKAAKRGDSEACWRLGYCYHNGFGVKKNYRRAAELFQRSAKSGDDVGRNVMSGRRFFQFGAVKDSNQAILHSISDEKDHFSKELEILRKN